MPWYTRKYWLARRDGPVNAQGAIILTRRVCRWSQMGGLFTASVCQFIHDFINPMIHLPPVPRPTPGREDQASSLLILPRVPKTQMH